MILTSHRKNEGWKRPPFNLKKTALVKDLLIPIWYPGIVFRVVWQRGPANDAPECNFCLTWPSSWLAYPWGVDPDIRHAKCVRFQVQFHALALLYELKKGLAQSSWFQVIPFVGQEVCCESCFKHDLLLILLYINNTPSWFGGSWWLLSLVETTTYSYSNNYLKAIVQ